MTLNLHKIKFYLKASLGLLLVLSFTFSSITCDPQDRYSARVPSFKITVPRKVSEDGTFLSHYIPHFYDTRRRKRDLSGEQLHYIIPVDDVEHHVQLWPNTDFLSPGMVIEDHSLHGNTSRITIRKPKDMQCHYTGIVRGVEQSRVALSTCYGLAGQVKTPHDEFIIEPSLERIDTEEYHKHYIYKREDIASITKSGTNCGTKGKFNEALKQRMDWEKKYGEKIEKSLSISILDDISRSALSRRSGRAVDSNQCPPIETTTCLQDQLQCPLKTPRFLEVMICIDHKLEKLPIQDTETFIITIMNMVSVNFHDQSIGEPIHVFIVRLLFLGYTVPKIDPERYIPSALLENFCDWQLEINPLMESHPNHHDLAVYVTNFQPCQGNILGLANMASVCRLDKSCVVVSEEGLLLANIITHQFGHSNCLIYECTTSLGAEHDDGEVGGCAGEEPDGTRYHMSPYISRSSSAWSTCSRQCIAQFLDTRIGWCMADPPDEHDFKSPDILPGQVYDAVKQCTLNFKMRTLACRTGDFCKTLYCQISDSKCATNGDPPADGTPCAMNMWCFNGDCVHRGQRPGAIQGQWGPWNAWTPCTRSCGAGVQSRFRSCDNPAPARGGRDCVGDFMTYRMCSIKPCPGYVPTFVQIQCKATDKRPYRGHYFLWDHVKIFFEDMKCTLICINELNQISIRSPVVIDGTPCEPGTNNVCIHGTCRRVGCDYVIESRSKEDMCGVCHGPGVGCKVVQGVFSDPNVDGVVPFLNLPAGTSVIYIRQMDRTSCYLIISSAINSTFYLNGPSNCDHLPGEFDCAGTTGVFDDKLGILRVFVKGALQGPITVSIKCNPGSTSLPAINTGVKYQYALPEEPHGYIPSYSWSYLYWEECSRACGGGAQRAKPVCLEKRGGEVEEKYCNELTKPRDLIRTCNVKPCTAKWWIGPWSNCDCQDGEGIMTRVVLCMKPIREDTTIAKVVKDKECCNQPKPRVQKPCDPDKDFYSRRKRQYEVNPIEYSSLTSNSFHLPSYSNYVYNVNGDYLNHLNDENGLEEVDTSEDHVSSSATVEDGEKTKKTKKKNRRRRKKMRVNATSSTPMTDLSTTPEEEIVSVLSEKSRPVGKNLKESATDRNETQETEAPSSSTIINKMSTVCDDNQSVSAQSQSNTTAKTTTGSNRNTCSTAKSTCTLDYFLEHFYFASPMPTCAPSNNEMEPADLGPILETANHSLFQLVIVPLTPDKNTLPKTDIEVQSFGDSSFWPIGSISNKTYISGDNIFKLLQEARRRGTKPPPIEPGSN